MCTAYLVLYMSSLEKLRKCSRSVDVMLSTDKNRWVSGICCIALNWVYSLHLMVMHNVYQLDLSYWNMCVAYYVHTTATCMIGCVCAVHRTCIRGYGKQQ